VRGVVCDVCEFFCLGEKLKEKQANIEKNDALIEFTLISSKCVDMFVHMFKIDLK